MTIQLAHKRVLAFIRGSSPAALEIDYMEYATDGAAQSAYVTSATAPTPTGGTITTDGDYTVHKFTSNGTFTTFNSFDVEYLVVAGGGGGGYLAGGGAGGYRTATGFGVTAQAYGITVGAGGAGGGGVGNDSVFSTITSDGGGAGGSYPSSAGGAGGSGGGGGAIDFTGPNNAGGTATVSPSQGNDGGDGIWYSDGNSGGGGGGAGAAGADGANLQAGAGGVGLASSITGSSVYYAGGGGSGGYTPLSINAGAGGNGGGGAGAETAAANGTAGTANTGGGGGGGAGGGGDGAAGGSGIVIIRYLTADALSLDSFSESTIKTEGSYALKLSATTDSLNETVTKTLTGGDILDLTGKNTIKLDARSTGTGSNLEMSIRDSGNENSGNLFIEAETDITDKNGTHTITAVGDAALSKAQISSYNNSSASVIFDGTGDYLSVPTHADFDFGTGDWTVDFSFYTNTVTSANDGLFTLEAGTENILSVWVGNNVIFCKVNSSQQTITVSASTWYHLAIERYGNTVTAYLDGVAEQTWDVTGISFDDNSAGIEIGGYATVGTYTLDGYMDNFRIVKGTSIFQSAFTPSNTTLLYPEYQTHTIDIVAADTYQAEVVDISDIADADKDDIDLIQFKVLNEDSARTFYIDNIRASADEYAYLTATGGTITYDGDYKIHTFTSDGTFTVKSLGSTEDEVEALVVAGGGAGGGSFYAGGGGGGGVVYHAAKTVTVQAYGVTVGAGGAGVTDATGCNGSNSVFNGMTAVGGGGGAEYNGGVGEDGGSGGGAGGGGGATAEAAGGSGTQGASGGGTGYGENGGAKGLNVIQAGGGGGGAGAVGESSSVDNTGADGGAGISNSISGASVTYGGGGGGSVNSGTPGVGGAGGGGNGTKATPDTATAGTANTGGGGGGSSSEPGTGENGGSGIVILKYQYK